MARRQVEASAPVAGDVFPRHVRGGCLDGDHFDTASEVLGFFSNRGFQPPANNQNCRWFAPAHHFADMGIPARPKDGEVVCTGDQLGALLIQGGDARIDQPNTGTLHFVKQV